MLGLTLFSIFIFIVIAIVVVEVRNERKYQEKRRQRRGDGRIESSVKPKNDVKLEKQKEQKQEELKQKKLDKDSQEEKAKEEKEVKKKLPTCMYPKFSHVRLVEMGLSEEESKEFVEELIPQLEAQIPLIETELNNADFHKMERLTHSLKGSATNLGTGGISDLLVECNTYLKTGTDADIATVYFEYLKHYTKELREQYL